jgi:L-lactate dehydrogenase (cytochrome)
VTFTSFEDLRACARRRLPRAVFDYADGGAGDELTLERNRVDLDRMTLRQRVMVDVSRLSLTTTLAGSAAALPVAIAPTGMAGWFRRDGEILGARAAQAFGVPFCLSTMSVCSIEDVQAAVSSPFWFQLYLMRDRGFNSALIDRARAAGCSALVLTLDLTVMGVRRRDVKNGMTTPPRLTWRNALDIATKPSWVAGVLFGKRHTFGNLEPLRAGGSDLASLAEWTVNQFDASITWDDVAWVRERWPGRLILKGVLDAADAELACRAGPDAIVVSNHGGRQLDGAPSAISVLPKVVEAVNGRCEVLVDGGIRSGTDILRALALGARGCLVGKAFLFALAAAGESGVETLLELLKKELAAALALTGQTDVKRVARDVLR